MMWLSSDAVQQQSPLRTRRVCGVCGDHGNELQGVVLYLLYIESCIYIDKGYHNRTRILLLCRHEVGVRERIIYFLSNRRRHRGRSKSGCVYIPFAYDFRQRTTCWHTRTQTHACFSVYTYILLYRRAINNCPRGVGARRRFLYITYSLILGRVSPARIVINSSLYLAY